MKNYFVFVIQGYETVDKEKNQVLDVVEFQLIAKNEEEAMNKARAMKKKSHYRLHTVIEREHGT